MNKKIPFITYLFFILIYANQGLSGLPGQALYYLKRETWCLSATQLGWITFAITIPWTIKPLYGLITDCFPIKNYRTKYHLIISYILLLLCIAYILFFGFNLISMIVVGFIMSFCTGFNDVCVSPNSLVLTKTGLKKICEISIGEYVLTHNNRWQKVLKVYKKLFIGKIKNLNNELLITKNHPFYTTQYKKCEGRLKLDSYIPTWKAIQDFSKKYLIGLINIKNSESFNYDGLQINLCQKPVMDLHTKNNIPTSFKLFKEFLIFIGLFIGDGCLVKNRNGIEITLGNKDIEAKKILTIVAKKLHFSWHVYKIKNVNAIKYRIDSLQLSGFFKSFYSNYQKHLPEKWLNLSMDLFKYIIYGFYLADGNKIYNKGRLYGVEICNTNLLLLNNIKIRCEHDGILPIMRLLRKKGKIQILNKICNCSDYYSLQFRSTSANRIFSFLNKTYQNSKRPQLYKELFYYIIKPIKKISSKFYNGLVYNLEVEHDNSYIVNGYIVHNCNDTQMVVLEQKHNLSGRIQAIQWTSLGVAGLAVSLGGAYIASLLPEPFNYKLAYAITAILPLITLIYLTKFYKEKKSIVTNGYKCIIVEVKKAINKPFLLGLAFIACLQFSPSFGNALMITIREQMGVDKIFLGYTGAIGTVVGLVGYLLYYWKAYKFPLKKLLYFAIIFGAITNLFYLYLPNKYILIIYNLLFGAFGGISFLAIMSFMAKIIPKGAEGLLYALATSVNNFAGGLSEPVGGFIYDKLGYNFNVIIATGFTLLCLFFIPKLDLK